MLLNYVEAIILRTHYCIQSLAIYKVGNQLHKSHAKRKRQCKLCYQLRSQKLTHGQDHIIQHFLNTIVYDNRRQLENKKVRNLCDELEIKKHFLTVHHTHANDLDEVVNKTIMYTLKRKLDDPKRACVDSSPKFCGLFAL